MKGTRQRIQEAMDRAKRDVSKARQDRKRVLWRTLEDGTQVFVGDQTCGCDSCKMRATWYRDSTD